MAVGELLEDLVDEGLLGGGFGGAGEEFAGGLDYGIGPAVVRDEFGDNLFVSDDIGKGEELGAHDGSSEHVGDGVALLVEDDHGLAVLGDLKGDGAGLDQREVGPIDDDIGLSDGVREAHGPGAGGECFAIFSPPLLGKRLQAVDHRFAGGGDDAGELREVAAEGFEDIEDEREVAFEFCGAGAGHEGELGGALREASGGGVEGGDVQRLIKEHVPDEAGGDVATGEEGFLEGEEAEDQISQAAEFVDAPAAPGPDLRGDEVDDFGTDGFGEFADGEVGGGGIDGNVDFHGVGFEPVFDAGVDLLVFANFLVAGDAHNGIVTGVFDDGGAGGGHFAAAPGSDAEFGTAAFEFGDDLGRVFVAGRLEGCEKEVTRPLEG